MSNFTLSQSVTPIGVCEKLLITDTSNYSSNTEGFTVADVQNRIFTVRDLFGNVLFNSSVPASQLSIEVPISLLNLQVKFGLTVYFGIPYNVAYGLENIQYVPCIGV